MSFKDTEGGSVSRRIVWAVEAAEIQAAGVSPGSWMDAAADLIDETYADDPATSVSIVWWHPNKGHGRGFFEQRGDVVNRLDEKTDAALKMVNFDRIFETALEAAQESDDATFEAIASERAQETTA